MVVWVAALVVKNGWTAIEAGTVGVEVVASILWVWIFIMTGPVRTTWKSEPVESSLVSRGVGPGDEIGMTVVSL